jgi:hypothetical protein
MLTNYCRMKSFSYLCTQLSVIASKLNLKLKNYEYYNC